MMQRFIRVDKQRLVVSVLLIASAIFLPPWVFLFLLSAGMLLLPRYYSGLIILACYESAFSGFSWTPFGILLPVSAIALAAFIAVEFVRGRLRE